MKSKIIDNLKNGWNRFCGLGRNKLHAFSNLTIWAIVGDLFFVFYWLNWQTIGLFLFVMLLIFLVMVLIAGRRYPEKMKQPKKKKREEEEEEEEFYEDEETEEDEEMDNGIPYPDLGISQLQDDMEDIRQDIQNSLRFCF